MLKRIFLAINLPREIKKEIKNYQDRIGHELDQACPLPNQRVSRLTDPENLHLTLAFLGNIKEDRLMDLYGVVERSVSNQETLKIYLTQTVYGPPGKTPPRMIWLQIEPTEELSQLKKTLNENLERAEGFYFTREKRDFSPHITLARLNTLAWSRIEPEERPVVEEEINLLFKPKSVDVMESELRKKGPKYSCLKSFSFVS